MPADLSRPHTTSASDSPDTTFTTTGASASTSHRLLAAAQNEQVEPVASRFPASCVHGPAEAFLAPEELLLGELAQSRVGVPEGVHLAEELCEARRVRLANLLESVPLESRGCECLAAIGEGGKGPGRPDGLGEPAHHLDRLPLQVPRR